MMPVFNEALDDLKPSAIRAFSTLAKNTPGCIALTLGEPDFDTPAEISKQVQKSIDAAETHYIPNAGTQRLRTRIARFEQVHNGRSYSDQNVLVTDGAEEGLFLSLFSLLNPKDEVIVPVPCYTAYESIIHLCRGTMVPLDTSADSFQITREKLNPLITARTKAIVLNTPNNPTGTALNDESLKAVRDAVKGKEIFVICDDVYQQLVYQNGIHSYMDFNDDSHSILVQSFSKPYAMTGWRMGYVCAEETLIQKMTLVHQFIVTSTPSLFQDACTAALDYDPSSFIETYRKRKSYVCRRLAEAGLETVEPDGAFYVFPSIEKYGLSSEEFCRRMIQETKVAAVPGSAFGCEGHIRISYCCSDDTLKEGLNRLCAFLTILESEGRG